MKRKIALAVLSSLLAATFAAASDQSANAQVNHWELYDKELKYLAKKGIPHPWGLPNPYEAQYGRNYNRYYPYGVNPYNYGYGYGYDPYGLNFSSRSGNLWF